MTVDPAGVRKRWTLRCHDDRSRERFLTTSVESGQVRLLVPGADPPAVVVLSTRDVSRLRRQLADAQAAALDEVGFDEDAG